MAQLDPGLCLEQGWGWAVWLSWAPHSSWCANLLDENSASMWALKCFAFSLRMHCQTKILLAAVIKSFMFIRPQLRGGCASVWVGLGKVANLFTLL